MEVGGPQEGGLGPVVLAGEVVAVAYPAYRLVQRVGGSADVEGALIGREVGVEGVGDLVVDLPQGADDVGESGELEGGGQMDGFVDELGVWIAAVWQAERRASWTLSRRTGAKLATVSGSLAWSCNSSRLFDGSARSLAPWQAKCAIWHVGRDSRTLALVGRGR